MLGPILDGARVRLEPPLTDHLATFVRWFADPVVTRYLYRRWPPSLRQEEQWFEGMAASQEDLLWSVAVRDAGTLAGVIAFHRVSWRDRHGWLEVVLGERREWGKGYGTEAMRLCVGYAFRELGFEKVLASVYSDHPASLRMVEKVGFRRCGLFRRNAFFDSAWHDEWFGEILRDEWTPPAA
jgi:RimJ/RimL family protein N-acetyltransferase